VLHLRARLRRAYRNIDDQKTKMADTDSNACEQMLWRRFHIFTNFIGPLRAIKPRSRGLPETVARPAVYGRAEFGENIPISPVSTGY